MEGRSPGSSCQAWPPGPLPPGEAPVVQSRSWWLRQPWRGHLCLSARAAHGCRAGTGRGLGRVRRSLSPLDSGCLGQERPRGRVAPKARYFPRCARVKTGVRGAVSKRRVCTCESQTGVAGSPDVTWPGPVQCSRLRAAGWGREGAGGGSTWPSGLSSSRELARIFPPRTFSVFRYLELPLPCSQCNAV